MQQIAQKIIIDRFKDKVLEVGAKDSAYINRRSAGEYAYPANKRLVDDVKQSKMRASKLDNLLAVSEFINHESDDGRHEKATGGWDNYRTRFMVNDEMFEGIAKIMNTERGRVFYDVTQIKKIARLRSQPTPGSAATPSNLFDETSMDILPGEDSTENGLFIKNISAEQENSQEKIQKFCRMTKIFPVSAVNPVKKRKKQQLRRK